MEDEFIELYCSFCGMAGNKLKKEVGQQQVATVFIFLSHITMWEG